MIRISKRYIVIFSIVILVVVSFSMILRSIYVVPVLMYHKIDENAEVSKLSVSPKSFSRQMKFLRDNNYNVLSLSELAELINSKKPISYKTVVVAFDDGYENNYTNAFSSLKEYNIPATIFIPVNKIGKKGYLTWSQLKEMSSNGIDIGSHTLSECYLPDIKDDNRLWDEISRSRKLLRAKIPGTSDFIAYCSGGFNEKIRQMVIDAGYKGACATNPGKDYPDNDIYAIKRVRISRTSDNLFVFWIETSGFYTWIKEHRDD